jgi:hypothetical protein
MLGRETWAEACGIAAEGSDRALVDSETERLRYTDSKAKPVHP